MCVIVDSDWRSYPFRDARQFFGCGQALDHGIPAVAYFGHDGPIVLPLECTRTLGCSLVEDSREAQLALGQPAHWARRAARAAGMALAGQEARR